MNGSIHKGIIHLWTIKGYTCCGLKMVCQKTTKAYWGLSFETFKQINCPKCKQTKRYERILAEYMAEKMTK